MSKKGPKKHELSESPGPAPGAPAPGGEWPPAAAGVAGERETRAREAGEREAPAGEERAAGPPPGEERLRELERELDAARAEAASASDRALRTLAEFDNYRRRTERERDESMIRGRADVLRELLEVADNFDRALEHAGDAVPRPFVEGMQLVARGLHDLLDRKGVARIDAEGKPFDPELHEALSMMPVDGAPPGSVVQVVQAGYRLGDRVLRPAKVIVAAAPPRVDAPEDAGVTDPGEDA
jgi:molecular chaperone GrpE